LIECFDTNYYPEEEDTETINEESWGTWQEVKSKGFRFSRGNEFYKGHYGTYSPSGYIKEFYPYDQTKNDFLEEIKEMRHNKYIKIGPTKIVDIDFSLIFPTSSYFVAVNMLLEFTPQGQVVPTRIDILPYKFGAFAKYNIDPTGTIDIFKFMLVIYTVTIVVQNFMALKTWRKMLTMTAFFDNFTDMMVIFLQTYCFSIKL
jgi:hypothetical protein